MKIVFFAKGSRGDVQPLAALAISLKEQCSTIAVEFVCDFRAPQDIPDTLRSLGIAAHTLPTPQHVLGKDVSSLLVLTDEEKLKLLTEELKAAVSLASKVDGIVFNLFACEMWFVAYHQGVPCVCASTFFVSRAPVSGFEKKLERSFPELYRKLKESTEGEVLYAFSGAVTYGEVEHWMWRLFLDDFGQATEAVGLPSIPFLNSSGCVPSSLPPPTPLIYGISPHVLQSQPYWPPSVCLSGYWPLDERYLSPPTADDVRIVSSLQSPILYAGFGSMEDVYEIEWKKMVKLLANAAAAHKMEVVLQSRRVPPSSLTTYPSIHLLSNPVPHQWLFPRCSIILCHGGCGTVSSALLSGKPIIVSPFGFDQFFWAEQVEWLGVGRQCSHADTITEEELTKAVGFVTCPHVQQAVENMAGKLSQEKGIESAMDILVKHLNLSS